MGKNDGFNLSSLVNNLIQGAESSTTLDMSFRNFQNIDPLKGPENWTAWKMQMYGLLHALDLKAAIDERLPEEDEKNVKAYAFLISSIKQSVITHLPATSVCYDLWATLKDKFECVRPSRLFALMSTLLNRKLTDPGKVAEFFDLANKDYLQLNSAAKILSEKAFVLILMNNIAPSFQYPSIMLCTGKELNFQDLASNMAAECATLKGSEPTPAQQRELLLSKTSFKEKSSTVTKGSKIDNNNAPRRKKGGKSKFRPSLQAKGKQTDPRKSKSEFRVKESLGKASSAPALLTVGPSSSLTSTATAKEKRPQSAPTKSTIRLEGKSKDSSPQSKSKFQILPKSPSASQFANQSREIFP